MKGIQVLRQAWAQVAAELGPFLELILAAWPCDLPWYSIWIFRDRFSATFPLVTKLLNRLPNKSSHSLTTGKSPPFRTLLL